MLLLLDENHIPVVLKAIKTIVGEWENLGLNLGIEKHVLDELKYNYPHQVQVCRKEMISYWIMQTKNATCNKLISALKDLGENNIIADIEKHFHTLTDNN